MWGELATNDLDVVAMEAKLIGWEVIRGNRNVKPLIHNENYQTHNS
jgi:hypothetical protein